MASQNPTTYNIRQWSLIQKSVLGGFLLALTILLIIGLMMQHTASEISHDNEWVRHTYVVLQRLESILANLSEAEADQRGYLLTSLPRYLDSYTSARQVTSNLLSELRNLTRDNAQQQEALGGLERLVNSRLDYLQHGIDLRNTQGINAAINFLLTDLGASTMENVKQAIEKMKQTENSLLTERVAQSQDTTGQAVLLFSIGTTISFVLLILSFFILAQQIRRQLFTERALRASEARYETLINNFPNGVVLLFDRELRFLLTGGLELARLGTSPNRFIGKRIQEFFPPTVLEQVEKPFLSVFEGQSSQIEINVVPQAVMKREIFTIQLVPIRDEHGDVMAGLAMTQNITKQKEADEAILKLNHDLEERARAQEALNKELEAFSYSVSHDLRAPLRAINGFSQILVDEYAPQLSDKAQHYLKYVTDNAKQMGQLIDDLLGFSRLNRQPLTKKVVNSKELVQEVLKSLQSEVEGRNLEISVGDLPNCEADRSLLRQVYVNLLLNAIKYTRHCEVAKIEIGWKNAINGEKSAFYVKDNGAGFDMTYAHKLFGVFQRLHRAEDYEGTGVGLATVQRIVHRHGGEIWADAKPEHGASFYFTLGSIEGALNG